MLGTINEPELLGCESSYGVEDHEQQAHEIGLVSNQYEEGDGDDHKSPCPTDDIKHLKTEEAQKKAGYEGDVVALIILVCTIGNTRKGWKSILDTLVCHHEHEGTR